jgi:hypothetical protein
MEVSDAKRLRGLEHENRRLKEMVADLSLDKELIRRSLGGAFSAWKRRRTPCNASFSLIRS